MKKVSHIILEAANEGRLVISFEFFTPRSQEAEKKFYDETLPALLEAEPDFCSVTYGAGGSTRSQTLEMVAKIQDEFKLPSVAHFTCIGATRNSVAEWLGKAKELGIKNILALRGDPPQGITHFDPSPDGFRYAVELVSFIKGLDEFCIGVAGFPEGHPECKEGKHANWRHLKAKIDAGAEFVITQLFFENAYYYEFRDYMVKELLTDVPLIPGIIPILSVKQIERFISICGATLPDHLYQKLLELGDDDEGVRNFGVKYAIAQCVDLLEHGVRWLHFYSLNRADSVIAILKGLGIFKKKSRMKVYP